MATVPGVRGRSGSLALVRVLVTASMAGTLARGHDLGRQGALAGDPDQLAAPVPDREPVLVGGLQRADHVGPLVAARRRPAPADDHPLTHVLGADADDVAVAHPTTVEPCPTPTPLCGGSPAAWPRWSATCTGPSGKRPPTPARRPRRPSSGPRRPGCGPWPTPGCSPRSPAPWPTARPGGPAGRSIRPSSTCWPTRSPRPTGPSW